MPLPHNAQDVDNFITFGVINSFKYTNWKGETEFRKVIPCCIRYGSSPHHPEEQWLLEAYDLDKDALRTFALKDIHPR